ncbi:hypothetical protein GCM10025868_04100 [Angustibacter aerolatus]|uniref:Membrane transport protein MMPL domain-containing protein n=1 Tax=Angustibacter aerolatus TaxID=1162965 RepID=A0ABQ6JD78_9ACTN|nr:hypothetical protein GCM10025868_04100 [Angustibacter aerolatus]
MVHAITGQVEGDLRTGEGVALPVSLVVMVLVFGGFLAAGLPLAGALASIAGALASLLAFTTFLDLDATVVNVVTILGLGLCIDYGLLLVSRFREERAPSPGRPGRMPPPLRTTPPPVTPLPVTPLPRTASARGQRRSGRRPTAGAARGSRRTPPGVRTARGRRTTRWSPPWGAPSRWPGARCCSPGSSWRSACAGCSSSRPRSCGPSARRG